MVTTDYPTRRVDHSQDDDPGQTIEETALSKPILNFMGFSSLEQPISCISVILSPYGQIMATGDHLIVTLQPVASRLTMWNHQDGRVVAVFDRVLPYEIHIMAGFPHDNASSFPGNLYSCPILHPLKAESAILSSSGNFDSDSLESSILIKQPGLLRLRSESQASQEFQHSVSGSNEYSGDGGMTQDGILDTLQRGIANFSRGGTFDSEFSEDSHERLDSSTTPEDLLKAVRSRLIIVAGGPQLHCLDIGSRMIAFWLRWDEPSPSRRVSKESKNQYSVQFIDIEAGFDREIQVLVAARVKDGSVFVWNLSSRIENHFGITHGLGMVPDIRMKNSVRLNTEVYPLGRWGKDPKSTGLKICIPYIFILSGKLIYILEATTAGLTTNKIVNLSPFSCVSNWILEEGAEFRAIVFGKGKQKRFTKLVRFSQGIVQSIVDVKTEWFPKCLGRISGKLFKSSAGIISNRKRDHVKFRNLYFEENLNLSVNTTATSIRLRNILKGFRAQTVISPFKANGQGKAYVVSWGKRHELSITRIRSMLRVNDQAEHFDESEKSCHIKLNEPEIALPPLDLSVTKPLTNPDYYASANLTEGSGSRSVSFRRILARKNYDFVSLVKAENRNLSTESSICSDSDEYSSDGRRAFSDRANSRAMYDPIIHRRIMSDRWETNRSYSTPVGEASCRQVFSENQQQQSKCPSSSRQQVVLEVNERWEVVRFYPGRFYRSLNNPSICRWITDSRLLIGTAKGHIGYWDSFTERIIWSASHWSLEGCHLFYEVWVYNDGRTPAIKRSKIVPPGAEDILYGAFGETRLYLDQSHILVGTESGRLCLLSIEDSRVEVIVLESLETHKRHEPKDVVLSPTDFRLYVTDHEGNLAIYFLPTGCLWRTLSSASVDSLKSRWQAQLISFGTARASWRSLFEDIGLEVGFLSILLPLGSRGYRGISYRNSGSGILQYGPHRSNLNIRDGALWTGLITNRNVSARLESQKISLMGSVGEKNVGVYDITGDPLIGDLVDLSLVLPGPLGGYTLLFQGGSTYVSLLQALGIDMCQMAIANRDSNNEHISAHHKVLRANLLTTILPLEPASIWTSVLLTSAAVELAPLRNSAYFFLKEMIRNVKFHPEYNQLLQLTYKCVYMATKLDKKVKITTEIKPLRDPLSVDSHSYKLQPLIRENDLFGGTTMTEASLFIFLNMISLGRISSGGGAKAAEALVRALAKPVQFFKPTNKFPKSVLRRPELGAIPKEWPFPVAKADLEILAKNIQLNNKVWILLDILSQDLKKWKSLIVSDSVNRNLSHPSSLVSKSASNLLVSSDLFNLDPQTLNLSEFSHTVLSIIMAYLSEPTLAQIACKCIYQWILDQPSIPLTLASKLIE